MPLPVVAIVGRPNVGKSTLFNRLVGFRKSVVDDRPGVTRDRIYELAELEDRKFFLIDTGGLDPNPDTDLLQSMREQVLVAVEEATVILFVVDGRAGYSPADAEVASMLRLSQKPVLLLINKIDGPKHEDLLADFYSVGFGDMLAVSAEHGRGMYDMYEALVPLLPVTTDADFDYAADGVLPDDDEVEAPTPNEIRIAVIGRPNIGKSTLVNRMLGAERHVVHDSPGTTTDSVDSKITVDGVPYLLVDTAGVRRKSKVADHLERFITLRAIQSIERCHISLLVVDATEGLTSQDAKLAELVIGRGRALIILFNKWDLTKEMDFVNAKGTADSIYDRLPHAKWAPHLFIAAKTGKGVGRLLPLVKRTFESFNQRIKTAKLNAFLEQAMLDHSPPQRHHHPVRLYYMTQNRIRPPTFVFWSNTPEGVVKAYERYLSNRLRDTFGFSGTPLKLHFRKRRTTGPEKTK
jgi:GTP-binding protein